MRANKCVKVFVKNYMKTSGLILCLMAIEEIKVYESILFLKNVASHYVKTS